MLNLSVLTGRPWQAVVLTSFLAISGAVYGGPDPDPAAVPGPAEKAMVRPLGGSFLGVGVSEITTERAKALNLREEYGVEITHVEEDSPASKGGLKLNDVVLEYNGQRVEGIEQFMRLVRETPPGREVKLTVSRNGGMQNMIVTTGSRKAWIAKNGSSYSIEMPNIVIPEIQIPDIPKAYMSWRSTLLGVEAESIDGQLAQFFGVKGGVLVRSVLKSSAAEKAGLKAGDIITKVDSTTVSSPREISSAIRAARPKKSATLGVVRERREISITVALEERESDPEHSGRTGQKAIRVHAGSN